MKFFPVIASALVVVCIASSSAHGVTEEVDVVPVVGQELEMTPTMLRILQTSGSSTTDTNTDAPTPTTQTPKPETPAPAPTPTTATPTTSAPTPDTETPVSTPKTSTPKATTATPEAVTPKPDATTTTPEVTTATPDVTTAPPTDTSTTPTDTSTTPTDTSTTPTDSVVTPTTTSVPSTSTNTTPSGATPTLSPTSNSGSGPSADITPDTSSGSSMSTGAVVGIVAGMIAAVAIIAVIIMCVIRRRRETEDDPLSPFELSMDKGYNPTPGGFNAQNSYNSRAMGVTAGNGLMTNTRTPSADAVAPGVVYSHFYDNSATSPDSMNRLESNVDSVQTDAGNNAVTNGTNLWLSAMEPKDNESYLSAQESPRSSRNSSRNSYEMSSGRNIDMDQSSQVSGHSNKESDDFPDHHDDNDSARGSYEL